MRVSLEDIKCASGEEFKLCPHFFQENIKKDFELRIVYIDGVFYAFRIDSQIHEYYATDWRRSNQILDFIPYELPDSVREKLTVFMHNMGLFSGSIDMIVDPQGEYWFLECDQDGQWAWLDSIVEGAISDTFAHAFKYKLEEMSCELS
ncbi:hypothetical protein GCM10007972_23490 [Iodidimonas muriae]|uniref:SMI1/KNR4 family protein n=1 Tax=Iodidimonas muriae TaxID=261467 RepID=A0ABQ2LG04_9PROT|nr:hypothetical protein [Iodidimonas muriae]GER08610.1 hypothetical protein JCM17843_29200 [Kordiimonadales bacterium JCM 17843]GGO15405.1 hypothetical protein GCM10007972_23490 [Iodidimonas muriae]